MANDDHRGSESLRARLWNIAKDGLLTLAVIAIISEFSDIVFNHQPAEFVRANYPQFYAAVGYLSPLHLLDLLDDGDRWLQHILIWLLGFDYTAMPIDSHSIPLLAQVLGPLTFVLGLAVLPITVFVEGNWFDYIVMIIVYLPALLASRSIGLSAIFTVLVLWIMQILMLTVMHVFGQVASAVTPMACLVVGCQTVAGKFGESTLTDAVIQFVKHKPHDTTHRA